jgi:chemotaxis protein MotB
MNDESRPPIIIKRVKKVEGGHHGGAWKIAYADFVTAMMAFFLLMWLLGSTAEGDRKGIAEYFQTPLRVALAGGSGSGDSSSVIQGGGEDLTRSAGQVNRSDEPARRQTINLQAARAELRRREAERLEGLKQRRSPSSTSRTARCSTRVAPSSRTTLAMSCERSAAC